VYLQESNIHINVTLKRLRVTIVSVEKQYVRVLFIQHAMRMRRIVISAVPILAVLNFPRLSPKWHDIRENVIEHAMCTLIICTPLPVTRRKDLVLNLLAPELFFYFSTFCI